MVIMPYEIASPFEDSRLAMTVSGYATTRRTQPLYRNLSLAYLCALAMRLPFAERVRSGPIVCDGPLDAELMQRELHDRPVDLYNLTQPVVVEQLHRAFVDAGAEIVQTNTWHANRVALAEYKLEEKVNEINRRGVWLARTAAVNRAYVAGVIGPTRRFLSPIGSVTLAVAGAAFREQAEALIGGGAEAIFLNAFIDVEELLTAIESVRAVSADIPIVAHKTFPEDGAVLAGDLPARVAERLAASGVLAYGSNATVGGQRMLGFLPALWREGAILSAQPDASIPILRDGRPVYNATPEYLADTARALVDAGTTIVGIAGGATPPLVRAIADAVRGRTAGRPDIHVHTPVHVPHDAESQAPEQSRLGSLLARGEFVTTVELDIPRGLDLEEIVEGAEYLERHGIHAANITDGARARLRMGSVTISHEVQRRTGLECVTHLACRDRNMVALQSELMNAWTLGARNILAVTGDPTHIGDYPYATSVYDVDAIGLIRAASMMNRGRDIVGNPLGGSTAFTITCAANPLASDIGREMERLAQKVDQGTHAIFTQPLYELDALEQFMARVAPLKCPVVLGILPLRSSRHAEFLHHEVPGIVVPDRVRERMAQAGDRAAVEGVSIAVEFCRVAKSMVQGFYLLPPFKKYEMAVQILDQVL